MARLGTLVALALLLLAAAFWLFDRQPDAPIGGADAPPGSASPRADLAAADADLQTGNELETLRTDAEVDRDAPVYVMRGTVVADERAPDLSQVRVLAYEGQPQDASGIVTGAMATMQRGARAPGFVLKGDPIAEGRVAADGAFELRTRTPHLRVTIDHDFYLQPVPEVVHVNADTRRHHLVLSPLLGAKVRGRLLGPRSGDVDAVKLTLEPDPMAILRDARLMMAAMLAATRPEARPRDDGTFSFRAVAPGAQLAFAVDGSGVSGRTQEPALQAGEVRDVVLPVQDAAILIVEVVDERGGPLAGVRVHVRPAGGAGMTAMLQAHAERTDERGHCRFDRLAAGAFQVEANARGRTTARRDLDLERRDEPHRLQLTLGEGGVVTGIVRTPDGRPLAGARVAHHPAADIPLLGDLTDQLGPEYLRQIAQEGAETDESGHFRLTGISDQDPFLVVGAHEDFGAGVAREVAIGDEDVVVELQRLSGVLGTVTRAVDHQPVPRFSVSIVRTAFLVMKMPVASDTFVTTDGTFSLRGISPGSYTVEVEADGFGTFEKGIKVVEGQDVVVTGIELQRAASIRGVVRDEHGNPIANAMVQKRKGAMADNPMLTMLMGSGSRTFSDATGRFVLEPVSPGKLQLLATANGFASGRSERVAVAPGQQLEGVVIELGHGGSIDGVLRWNAQQNPDDFLLLAQHQVTQNTATAELRPDGTFRIDNLDPGSYQVQAMPAALMSGFQGHDWRPGEGLDIGEMMKQVTDNVVSQRCRVRADETAKVELDVRDLAIGAQWIVHVDVAGEPQAAGMVEATSLETGALRVAMIEHGTAIFGRVHPGRHRLQVRSGLTMTPVGAPQDLEFPASADEHTSTLSLPGGQLRGRVVDDRTGEPLARAIVRLHHDGHGERDDPIGMCLTDADGGFRFTGLTDGSYSLVAAEPLLGAGQNTASRRSGIEVRTGTSRDPVELRSRPAAGATVQVTTADGRPIRGATVLCVDDEGRPLGNLGVAATGPDGTASFGGMADGPARVVGRAPGYAPGATLVQTLSAEANTRFELRLGDGAPTRISVVDGLGKRLRGATVTARVGDHPWLPPMLLVQAIGPDGTIDVGELGPGRWSFRVHHPSVGTITRERTISGTAPVTIVVSKP
jgi:protocatechuate 3,4-dioxygenase beta subunit